MQDRPSSDTANRAAASVILVHGLWMTGLELKVLQRRLAAGGRLQAQTFSYHSLSGSMSDHVRRLVECARRVRSETLHFVGHSLGGLVILRALETTNDLPPGRAVLLGTPAQGSRSAQAVARRVPFGKALLGAAIRAECVEWSPRTWSGRRDVGVIAGSKSLGLGRLFAQLEGEHDGTVSVAETQLPGARDHLVLPVSHTSMLFAPEVAAQSVHFLRHGRFDHGPGRPAPAAFS